MPVILATYR